MRSNGTYQATYLDATNSNQLQTTVVEYVSIGNFTQITQRLNEYYIASNYQSTENNITNAGIITLFSLDSQLNSITGD